MPAAYKHWISYSLFFSNCILLAYFSSSFLPINILISLFLPSILGMSLLLIPHNKTNNAILWIILNNLNQPLMLLDLQQRIIYINTAWQKLLQNTKHPLAKLLKKHGLANLLTKKFDK